MDERRLYDLVHKQFGLFTLPQWLDAGLTRHQLQHRLKRGRVRRVFYKVFAVAGAQASFDFKVMAGCLKAGPHAAGFGGTAAAKWGLMRASDPVHIASVRRMQPETGYAFHRVSLPGSHISRPGGLPVTDVSRTLLDACGELYSRKSGLLIDKALRAGLVDLQTLRERCRAEARSGRNGITVMRAHLELRDAVPGGSRSELEARVFAFLLRHGFPPPERNQLLQGAGAFPWEVDLYWPKWRLVLEVDHYGTHGSEESFHGDREKILDLEARGYRVIRITDQMLGAEDALARKIWAVISEIEDSVA